MFKLIITFSFFFINTLCYSKASSDYSNKQEIEEHKNALSESPKLECIGFLRWYKKNENRINKISILTGSLKETSTNYSVDYKATKKYLQELKKSGFLSNAYIDSLFEYIKRCDSILKKYPQNDGPAQGFKADLIMKVQDYMDVMDNLDNYKIKSEKVNKSSAIIELAFSKFYKMTFTLTKYNGYWQIDTINGDFAKDISHY